MAGGVEAGALGAGVGVATGEAEAVAEARGLGEPDALDVALAETVGDAEPDADARADDEPCGDADAVDKALGEGDGDGEGLAVADGGTVGDSARAVVPSASDAAITTQLVAARMNRVGPTRDDTGGSRLRHAPSQA